MKRIVSNALAFVSETPAAAPEMKVQHTDRVPDDGAGFAEKLKDCENKSLTEVKPPGQEDEAEKKDNGMHDSPESMVYGIVGILEGFETPGYQTDDEASIAAAAAEPVAQALPQQTQGTMVPTQLEEQVVMAPQQQENTSELPGQIAWMHSSEEAGSGSAKTQDEILQIVGEYLDSLENTSNASEAVTPEAQTGTETGRAAAKIPASPESPEAAAVSPKAASESASPKGGEVAAEPAAHEAEDTGKAKKHGEADQSVKKAAEGIKSPSNESNAAANTPAANAAVPNERAAKEGVAPETAGGPEAPKPESVRESVTRIVDRVSTKATERKYDFDIDLKPDFMGKVSIKLTMEDGTVKVQIKADDISVKAMLQDQTSSLHTMLKEKGIPVTHIDVAYEGSAAPGSEGHAKQGEGRNPGGNLFYQQPENGTLESAKERYDFYFGSSNVEYLA